MAHGPVDDDATRRTILLIATGIAVALSAAVAGLPLTQSAPERRGVAFGLFVSAGVVLIGGVGLALLFF